MRLRALLAVSLIASGVLALPASASGCSTARAQSGVNPSYAQVSAAIDTAANRRRVPPALMRAIAWKESGWAQFWPDGRAKVSPDCGVGIMQITGGSWDYARLGRDYVYNIDAGAQVLAAKMAASSANVPSALRPDDIRVFENWYRATYRYNGAGYAAERYADSIFSMVNAPPSAIAPYSPAVRVTNPKHVIPGYAPTSGTAYVARIDGTWSSTRGTYRAAVQRADYLALSARMTAGTSLESDQQTSVTFYVRNIGYATWTPATVPLQTYPRGRASLLRSASWPGATTAAKLATNVVTGGTARYTVRATAARVTAARTVNEAFATSIAGVPIARGNATSRWTINPAQAPTAMIRSGPAYVTDQTTAPAATISISAVDPAPGAGLRRLELSRRRVCDTCTWSTPLTIGSTVRVPLNGEGAHQLRVRALDKAGHYSAWTAPHLVIVPRDNTSTTVTYDGTWTTRTTNGSYLGSILASSAPGAYLEATGHSNRLAIIGTRAPDAGTFAIYVDDQLVGTVSPVSDTVQQRQVLWSMDLPAGEHTLRVEIPQSGMLGLRTEEGEAAALIDAVAVALTA